MAFLRFVHAADLHLDSPFLGIGNATPPAIREILAGATFAAYDNLVDLCIRERVDALLVAGDVYDASDRSLRAQLRFRAGLERLGEAGIRAFVCHGNHDPLDGWEAGLTIPPSAHRFGPEVEAVPLDPARPDWVTVYGISYPHQKVLENLVPRFARDDSSAFAIGLLHANVGTNTGHDPYAQCTVSDLANAGLDYWALGHVHTRQVLRERGPAIVYPGNTQGRHPSEPGARGAFLVEVADSGEIRLDFHPLDAVRWESVALDVTRIPAIPGLLAILERSVGELADGADGRTVVYRIDLRGRGALHDDLLRPGVLDDLREQLNQDWSANPPFAWCESIVTRVLPEFDRERALAAGDFNAELLAVIDALKADPRALAAIQEALEPLYLNDRARKYIKSDLPDGAALVDLLDQAEVACVDALESAR